jgi:membrane-bound lytic murein transglycosylase A
MSSSLPARRRHHRPPRLAALALAALLSALNVAGSRGETLQYHLTAVAFHDLPGFSEDRLDEALKVFAKTCDRPIRSEKAIEGFSPAAQAKVCASARKGEGASDPRTFFTRYFRPYLVAVDPAADAFFTGYYQPEIPGSLVKTKVFGTPAYGLPPDLVTLSRQQRVGAFADLTAARRGADGALTPYPDRGAIQDGALENLRGVKTQVFLRDNVDLFLAQVQGSARVRLPDGRVLRLSFAGRNGQPYTALARVLVQRGVAAPADMTMRRLTEWIREHGVARGEAGDDLLRLNRSFVFFDARLDSRPDEQPEGGSGAALTPLRSIAIDSHIWPYGLPFFIDARMPWRSPEPEPFQRVMIAQDTGSAIVGPARADVYFGLADTAGARASDIRHHGRFYLLLPID